MNEQNRIDTHFTKRWRERGDPRYDGWKLQSAIMAAHRGFRNTGSSQAIEYVKEAINDGSEPCAFYRFLIEGVPYYVIIAERTSKIVTLYDQAMMRAMKNREKKAKYKQSGATSGGKRLRAKAKTKRRRKK